MRLSRLIGNRYKERPAEATLESHAFLLRGALRWLFRLLQLISCCEFD